MSTQTQPLPATPWRAPAEPQLPDHDGTEARVRTEQLPAIDQSATRPSLVAAWMNALRSAESLHLRLHPSYLAHSEAELTSFVQAALLSHRDASRLIEELFASGAGSLSQRRTA